MTSTQKAESAEAVPDSGGRYLALDGLRGLAILLVMQGHLLGQFVGIAYGIGPQAHISFDRFVLRVSGVGWTGVDLFFVLSGFLITGILYDAKGGAGFFRTFYARRFLRIFPVYYGFLLFILLIVPLIPLDTGIAEVPALRSHQWWYWTYTMNIGASLKDESFPFVHGHFWSLAVEEQFYLIWPAVVLVFARRQLMAVCLVLCAGAFLFRHELVGGLWSSRLGISAPYGLMPARIDTLALGAFVALAVRGPSRELERLARLAPRGLAGAFALLVVMFIARRGLEPWDTRVETIGFSTLAVFYACLLLMVFRAHEGAPLYSVFSNPVLRFFGRYAYAMYVFHLIVAQELITRFSDLGLNGKVLNSTIPAALLFTVVSIGCTMAAAFVSWHLYEKQFLKLKAWFPYEREGASRGATPLDAAARLDSAAT